MSPLSPRSEPLLWLQLVALGAIPLELLGLLLVLAGADPGPIPGLERLLVWAIGGLGTALLLWQRPADVYSLLLVQVPIRARSEQQRRLSALQSSLPLKLLLALAAAVELPLLWWMDRYAALATPLSPLGASPRFVCLLLACPLLSLILWQWQQLIQAVALLSRQPESADAPESSPPALTPEQLESQRLCLGLPLLLLSPLQRTPSVRTTQSSSGDNAADSAPADSAPAASPIPEAEQGSADAAVAVEPEETAEEGEGPDLDQQIP